MKENFLQILEEMKNLCEDFLAESQSLERNKSANKRARKITNALTKTGKTFRKLSVEYDKQK